MTWSISKLHRTRAMEAWRAQERSLISNESTLICDFDERSHTHSHPCILKSNCLTCMGKVTSRSIHCRGTETQGTNHGSWERSLRHNRQHGDWSTVLFAYLYYRESSWRSKSIISDANKDPPNWLTRISHRALTTHFFSNFRRRHRSLYYTKGGPSPKIIFV